MKDDNPRQFFACSLLAIAIAITNVGCDAQHKSTSSNEALVSFGEALFHDSSLSVDARSSCASCHQPTRHFTDGLATSIGSHGAVGTRNAPSLLDIPLMSTFFWDGRGEHLEDVVLQAFTNSVEMGLPDQGELVSRVNQKAEYREASGGGAATAEHVAKALTAFLRALPAAPTRYDLSVLSQRPEVLDDNERKGLALFNGKAGCADCHRTNAEPAPFTDNLFHHTGIGFEKVAGNITEMVQRLDHLKQHGKPLGQAILSDPDIAELGRFATTRRPGDLGAFRTPSLRNVGVTAPYMHDGSVISLEEAVERELYYRGLGRGRPISLTVEEQSQLIAFLHTLTADSSTATATDQPVRTPPLSPSVRR